MRIMLNENENNLCKEYLLHYLKDNCNLNSIENKIKSTYNTYIPKESNIIELVNDFYINEEKYSEFKNAISNQDTAYNYVINNLKELLIIDVDINAKYLPNINDKDNNIDNFVENGTLVLKIERIINYAIDEIILFKDLQSLENYTKSVEEYIKNKLNIPVRILFNDKAIVSE